MTIQKSEPPRLLWLDALRGFTMFLVVLGHVARGLHESGAIKAPIYIHLDQALYSVHGPLLFVLGGFTFRGAILRRPFWDSWRSRLFRILHPYAVWTLVTAGAMLGMASLVNNPLGLSDFARIVLLSPVMPYSIFWFLYVLAMTQVTFAWLVEKRRLGDGPILAIALLSLACNQLLLRSTGPVEVFQITTYFKYFAFFALGYLLAGRIELLSPRAAVLTGSIAGACWATIVFRGAGIDHGFGLFTGIVGCIFMFAFFRAMEQRLCRPIYVFWAFVGIWSLEIYVMHHLFNGAVRVGLNGYGVVGLPTHFLLACVAGTFGPILAAMVLRRLGLAARLGLTTNAQVPIARAASA